MHSLFSGSRVALLFVLLAGLLPLVLAGPQTIAPVRPQSRFHDWTTHYMLYPHFGTMAALEAARSDPRALFRWRELEQRQSAVRRARWLELQPGQPQSFFRSPRRLPLGHFPPRESISLHADWSISLGGGTTAPGQFPAKFTFDTTAPVTVANCTSDFMVYPVSANGSSTQPNIVGFRNLYSGTAGSTGICNRTLPINDDGVSATVTWSYNVHAIAAGGAVPTSPSLSLDGTKVAFVESAAGSPAHFHVLAWKSGDTNSANLQTTTSPKPITTFSSTSPAAGSGTATDLSFGTTTNTLSSPFIDYVRDLAYVGNDAGVLFRIQNVFCTLPACAGAAPSLDTTWNGTGSVSVCAGKLTGPVLDFVTLHVFVGCADGKVYGFSSTGSPLPTASIAIGDGSANGGVVESPLVDGVNGFIYAVSGTGAGTNSNHAVMVQATTSLGGPCTGGTLCVATIGDPNVHPAHAPAFNDNYFSSATSSSWLIYMGGFVGAGNLTLFAAPFSGARVMNAGAPPNSFTIGTRPGEYSPFTEFKNTNDWLFLSVLVTPPDIGRLNINSLPPALTAVSSGNGTSGMIVDNASTSAQASSIYFGTQSTNDAVKLTQAGLN